jgi:hypothetical protein
MPSKTLLPEQDELLTELVHAYSAAGDRPQIRVAPAGLKGARVWLWGDRRHELTGKRKPEDFSELCANQDLRRIKTDKTGTYYALTPPGLKRSADIAKKAAVKPSATSTTKIGPPPAILTSSSSRLDALRALAGRATSTLDAVLDASAVVESYAGLPVITAYPWDWAPLAPQDQRLIGAARTAVEAWCEGVRGAILASAPERIEDFTDEEEALLRIIDRSSRSDGPTAPDIAGTQRKAHEAVTRQLEVLNSLPSAHEAASTVLVPDTNALIFNPAVESWNVGNDRIVITVLPQVIAELDGKKMDPLIGEKAKSLIRRFKEFDRRGDTLVGVPVIGKVVFREVAIDSNFGGAPSWLNKRNADDRILAGALDIAQRELASCVILVTRDRNMQNKARRLALPYVDAEEL